MSLPQSLPSVALTTADPSLQHQAKRLADKYHIAFIPTPTEATSRPPCRFLLVLTPERVELRDTTSTLGKSVYVDFIGGPMGYRRRRGLGRGQALTRAVGLKAKQPVSVIDATAGFGRDAFVLACLGCSVVLIERAAAMAVLLEDGLRRACADAEAAKVIKERITLVQADSQRYLIELAPQLRPDVVYLDPMYPPRTKSALVKKEMRVLQQLVEGDQDTPALLSAALACARRRVVVKRPRGAMPIQGQQPSLAIEGKTTRYDVYLIP